MDGVFVSNEYPTFDIDQDRLLPRYLFWMFKRPHVWRQVAIGSKGMGDRRQRVHPEKVLSYRINLPSLHEQHRIVQRLDSVAAPVDERRRAIEAAERETQALLQKLLLVQQGDLVFSNIKAWEGAFAVAGPDDHGRVGSHRYLTCVPAEGLATAGFIWFYLQTHEGIGKA